MYKSTYLQRTIVKNWQLLQGKPQLFSKIMGHKSFCLLSWPTNSSIFPILPCSSQFVGIKSSEFGCRLYKYVEYYLFMNGRGILLKYQNLPYNLETLKFDNCFKANTIYFQKLWLFSLLVLLIVGSACTFSWCF